MSSDKEDDDVPQLSAETFAALQEFYKEQEERDNITSNYQGDTCSEVQENWQLSQFWYDDKTVDSLVNVALKSVKTSAKVALISCPTLYKRMKETIAHGEVHLYEYDRRFGMFGTDYVPYDYKAPLDIPRDKSSHYDLVIADPPFLSDECLTKTAVTMKFLSKNKLILCTGAIMADLAEQLLNLKKTALVPHHKNNLANEFYCFANYNIDEFLDS